MHCHGVVSENRNLCHSILYVSVNRGFPKGVSIHCTTGNVGYLRTSKSFIYTNMGCDVDQYWNCVCEVFFNRIFIFRTGISYVWNKQISLFFQIFNSHLWALAKIFLVNLWIWILKVIGKCAKNYWCFYRLSFQQISWSSL